MQPRVHFRTILVIGYGRAEIAIARRLLELPDKPFIYILREAEQIHQRHALRYRTRLSDLLPWNPAVRVLDSGDDNGEHGGSLKRKLFRRNDP
jgi:hypothetical protein